MEAVSPDFIFNYLRSFIYYFGSDVPERLFCTLYSCLTDIKKFSVSSAIVMDIIT